MSKYSSEAQALIDFLRDRKVSYHPKLARILGSVNAALWLSQLLWWDDKSTKHEDGWIEKTAKDFEEEIAMSGDEQERARSICIRFGVVEYERRGIPAMPCYRIDFDNLLAAVVENGEKSRLGKRYSVGKKAQKNQPSDCGKTSNKTEPSPHSQDCGNPSVISHKMTTEMTTEDITQPPEKEEEDSRLASLAMSDDIAQPAVPNVDVNSVDAGADAPFSLEEKAEDKSRELPPNNITTTSIKALYKSNSKEIMEAFRKTVEGMGYICTRANAKETFKELAALDTTPQEVIEVMKEVFKGWSRDKVVWVRFDQLPSWIRTCRVRVARGRMQAKNVAKAEEEDGYETIDTRGNHVWMPGKRPANDRYNAAVQ